MTGTLETKGGWERFELSSAQQRGLLVAHGVFS